MKIVAIVDGVVTQGRFGCKTGGTEKEQCRERKEWKRSSVFMKGVCGCGRRSPPILVAVRVNPGKKIKNYDYLKHKQLNMQTDSYFAAKDCQKV